MEQTIQQEHYDHYVKLYNDQGSQAAKDYVSEVCGMEINQFQRRMRRETEYFFNKSIKKYDKGSAEVEPFMSLEELCSTQSPRTSKELSPNSPLFTDLVFGLMRDRLIELQKFIHIDKEAKQIVVDKRSAMEQGYLVKMN